MAQNIWYEVQLEYTHMAVSCLNVFHYEQVDTTTFDVSGTEMAQQFYLQVFPSIQDICSDNLTFNSIKGYRMSLANPSFGEVPLSVTGDLTSTEDYPPFVTIGFMSPRLDFTQRNGYKRFSGQREEDYSNWISTSTHYALLEACATALSASIGFTASRLVQPCIIKRNVTNPMDVPASSRPATNWIVSGKLGSQNTRKR